MGAGAVAAFGFPSTVSCAFASMGAVAGAGASATFPTLFPSSETSLLTFAVVGFTDALFAPLVRPCLDMMPHYAPLPSYSQSGKSHDISMHRRRRFDNMNQ